MAVPTQQHPRSRIRRALLRRARPVLAAALALLVVEWVPAGSTGDGSSASVLPVPAPPGSPGLAVDPSTMIADPQVLTGRRTDYLYSSATGYSPPYVPVRPFHVLGRWGAPTDAMPTLPAWADSWIWNPDVRRVGGRYVMWFTAPLKGAALPTTRGPPRCLGWAVSRSPLGPFVPAPRPSVCQLGQFGAIDPQTLVAPGGQEWLYWKSDGNSVPSAHMPTVIWAQRLAAGGTTREGHPVPLLADRQPWEGTVVESPQMVRRDGRYYLFFSGNVSNGPANGIGVAPCRGPAGPCTNTASRPWLGSSRQARSVGEESLFAQDGTTWLLYSPQGLFQTLMVSEVAFGPAGPYVTAGRRLPSAG